MRVVTTLTLSPVGCIMAWSQLSPLLPLWIKPNTRRGRLTYSNMLSWRSSDQCSAEGSTPHYWTQCFWSRSTGEGMSSPPVHLTRSRVMDCVIVCCDIAADRSLSTHLSVLSFPSSLFIVSAAHSLFFLFFRVICVRQTLCTCCTLSPSLLACTPTLVPDGINGLFLRMCRLLGFS